MYLVLFVGGDVVSVDVAEAGDHHLRVLERPLGLQLLLTHTETSAHRVQVGRVCGRVASHLLDGVSQPPTRHGAAHGTQQPR